MKGLFCLEGSWLRPSLSLHYGQNPNDFWPSPPTMGLGVFNIYGSAFLIISMSCHTSFAPRMRGKAKRGRYSHCSLPCSIHPNPICAFIHTCTTCPQHTHAVEIETNTHTYCARIKPRKIAYAKEQEHM